VRRGSISGTHKRPRPCSRTRHGTPLTLTTVMQAGKPSVSAVATKPPSRVQPTKERRLLNGEEALSAAAPAPVSDSTSPTSESSNYRPPSWLGRRHTAETRRKMSEVHKKRKPVPWNKGKNLDPALREKIRAGVVRRNEIELQKKLKKLGLRTREEYDQWRRQQRYSPPRTNRTVSAESRQKISATMRRHWAKPEFRQRNSGRPCSNSTRAKLSRILTNKWALDDDFRNKTIMARSRAPFHGNKGYRHPEHVRRKISASLKAKWQEPEYREAMQKAIQSALSDGVRQQIADTVRKRWQDPHYRDKMKRAFAVRTTQHRQRISNSLKERWKDDDFRKRMDLAYAAYARRRTQTGPLSDEVRTKISETLKRRWADPEFRRQRGVSQSHSRVDQQRVWNEIYQEILRDSPLLGESDKWVAGHDLEVQALQ